MATTQITCSRCGQVASPLERAPLAGATGQLVLANVCPACWAAWFEQSVTVINHYGLNPAMPEHRRELYEVMKEYLNLVGK